MATTPKGGYGSTQRVGPKLCLSFWMKPRSKREHYCIEAVDHDGPHVCGCGEQLQR